MKSSRISFLKLLFYRRNLWSQGSCARAPPCWWRRTTPKQRATKTGWAGLLNHALGPNRAISRMRGVRVAWWTVFPVLVFSLQKILLGVLGGLQRNKKICQNRAMESINLLWWCTILDAQLFFFFFSFFIQYLLQLSSCVRCVHLILARKHSPSRFNSAGTSPKCYHRQMLSHNLLGWCNNIFNKSNNSYYYYCYF